VSDRICELVAYLARELASQPDAVRAEGRDVEGQVVIDLHVAPDDLGRVIGRSGRTARALRTVARAAWHDDRRLVLEIHGE